MKLFPNFYTHDFKSCDNSQENTLFMAALEKLLTRNDVMNPVNTLIKGKKGQALIEILSNARMPLRKELLIEKIWNIQYDPNYDTRFYKLVERISQNTSLNIINQNHAYKLAS